MIFLTGRIKVTDLYRDICKLKERLKKIQMEMEEISINDLLSYLHENDLPYRQEIEGEHKGILVVIECVEEIHCIFDDYGKLVSLF